MRLLHTRLSGATLLEGIVSLGLIAGVLTLSFSVLANVAASGTTRGRALQLIWADAQWTDKEPQRSLPGRSTVYRWEDTPHPTFDGAMVRTLWVEQKDGSWTVLQRWVVEP